MKYKILFLFSLQLAAFTIKAQDGYSAINNCLKNLRGAVSYEVWQYKGNKFKEKKAFKPSAKLNEGMLKTENAVWKYHIVSFQQLKDGGIKLNIKFKLDHGIAKETAVAVSFNFADWKTENYVMIPAAVYNGNRFTVLKGGYMPPYTADMYFNKGMPLTFSDNPRLALNKKDPSKIELLSWNMATPALSFFSPAQQGGFIVLTEPKTKLGISGLIAEENDDRSKAIFSVTAPGVREYAAGFGDFRKSDDKPHDWRGGEEVNLQLYIYAFSAGNIPSFLETFMDKRKSLIDETPQYYVAPMSTISYYTQQQVEKNRFNNAPFASIYFPENSFTRFQLGWIGGMMNTYPMLLLNDTLHLKRVANTIDFVVKNMQGKSGFFYGIIDDGKTLVPERELPTVLKSKYPGIISSAMVRKNADALLWFCKHFMLYKALDHTDEIKPEWEMAAKRLARAFVNAWQKNGDLGQYIDPESGEVLVFNSTAASVAPAGLAMAANYFNEPLFLRTAKEIAENYYHKFTEKLGLTGGNCGDISQDADSESAFGLLESFMALYWATGDTGWLAKAKVQAALCSTWVISYNYEFPPGTDLHSFDAHTTGGVWASAQNKHAAPGICTSSGDYLFKLYRATGDREYAELLRDIINGHTEQVELPGRATVSAGVKDQLRGTRYGSSMERIQISDAEGMSVIGKLYNGSNGWTELNGMLMSQELPGIYLQTDTDIWFVFDQVEVKRRKNKNGAIMLSIKNPTAYDAIVSVFDESSYDAKKPLGYTDYLKWEKVNVPAGKTVEVAIAGNVASLNNNYQNNHK